MMCDEARKCFGKRPVNLFDGDLVKSLCTCYYGIQLRLREGAEYVFVGLRISHFS